MEKKKAGHLPVTYFEIVVAAFGLFGAYTLLNRALALLNEASDVSVFLGYCILVALLCAGVAVGRWIKKRSSSDAS